MCKRKSTTPRSHFFNLPCSAFSPSQHSSIHILSPYLDLNSIAFFSDDRFSLIYPLCSLFLPPVLLFVREKILSLFVFLQFISLFLFLIFFPFSSSPLFLPVPSLQPSLSHLTLSLSFLPLTSARIKKDHWRPNADTLFPAPASTFFLSKILYKIARQALHHRHR